MMPMDSERFSVMTTVHGSPIRSLSAPNSPVFPRTSSTRMSGELRAYRPL